MEQGTNEFIASLVGEMGIAHFAMLMFFALIGATIKLTTQVKERDVASPATPERFSFGFLLADNWKRMLSSLLLIYVFVRFTSFLVPSNILAGLPDEAEMLVCILIGYSFDLLSEWLKDKASVLSVDRNKISPPTS